MSWKGRSPKAAFAWNPSMSCCLLPQTEGSSSFERWQTRQESQAGMTMQAGVEEPEMERPPSARMIRDEAVGNGISLFV